MQKGVAAKKRALVSKADDQGAFGGDEDLARAPLHKGLAEQPANISARILT